MVGISRPSKPVLERLVAEMGHCGGYPVLREVLETSLQELRSANDALVDTELAWSQGGAQYAASLLALLDTGVQQLDSWDRAEEEVQRRSGTFAQKH